MNGRDCVNEEFHLFGLSDFKELQGQLVNVLKFLALAAKNAEHYGMLKIDC